MSDIAPVSGIPGDRFDLPAMPGDRPATRASDAAPSRPSDRVDISDRARLLSKLASMPDIRQDVVDRVRAEIASGSYDSDEHLDQAIKNLAEDLGSQA